MRRAIAAVAVLATAAALAACTGGSPAEPAPWTAAGDVGGLDPAAPWPTMRHDVRNTGASDLPAVDPGGEPWSYRTGRGIFATPVIDGDGGVYIGSSDQLLYALAPDGTRRWAYDTGGIIDTAPALLPAKAGVGRSLVIGSGDERMRRLRTADGLGDSERQLWSYEPSLKLAGDQLVAWWEGSPNVGSDGTIFQGNTGGGAYAVSAEGREQWAHQTGNAVWTAPAVDSAGTTYWGSLDLVVRAVSAQGDELWRRTTLGFVASSPALSTDGTLFVGSFDGRLYALDSATGAVRWTVPTGDHIYSSPALIEDADGALQFVVVGSSDGMLYGITPAGEVAWAYDTGSPIRSSVAVGRAPDGQGWIAYAGAADGRLYAVDAADGRLRWAFDTGSDDPRLAAYNELNGSPAVGPDGVYVGGQSGDLWFVPYDYCLRAQSQPRCGAPELPSDGVSVVGPSGAVGPTAPVVARLVWREGGRTVPAGMVAVPDAGALVTVDPPLNLDVERSGDGRYLVLQPTGSWDPGTDYRVTVSGLASSEGFRLANTTIGARDPVPFTGSFTVRSAAGDAPWPLAVGPDRTGAVELSRLAVPLPPMLHSVNQIGFDFYDWVAGTVSVGQGETVWWVVGARRDAEGRLVADPAAGFAFPLSGPVDGSAFRLASPGVTLTFTFGPVPMDRFELNGRFDARGVVAPDAALSARVVCADVPGYETMLPLTGMCNPEGAIPVPGTFLGEVVESPAAQRPVGLTAGAVQRKAVGGGKTRLSADFRLEPGAGYPAADHAVHLLVLDANGRPASLDYAGDTEVATMATGDLASVALTVPTDQLPAAGEVVVMTDVFALSRSPLPGS